MIFEGVGVMKECELCEQCKRAIWDGIRDHGYSLSWIEGCKDDDSPRYNEEEECWECDSYKEVDF